MIGSFPKRNAAHLPPLRSLEELAGEVGLDVHHMAGEMSHSKVKPPQPVGRHRSTCIGKGASYYVPKDFRAWWAEHCAARERAA